LSSAPVPPPPRSTLFPYTTLFRSGDKPEDRDDAPHSYGDGDDPEHHGCDSHPVGWRPHHLLVDGLGGPVRRRFRSVAHVAIMARSEEHTSELQSRENLVCRLLLEK